MKKIVLSLFVATSFSVQAQQNISIYANQVGYLPNQEKVVVVEGINPKGKITVKNDKGEVLATPTILRKVKSPWGAKERYVVDLGSLNTPGRYTVSVKNKTQEINVQSDALHDITKATLKFFYLMRSGVDIEREYAGVYERPAAHLDTHVLIHPSAATNQRPAGSAISSPLGWYDAGDYNKYIVNSAFSIGVMLLAYQENKDYFRRLDTHIPESGNSTPDILDEMMFNLRWMLTMQDPNDGGVYHKLTTPNFEGFVMPVDCHQQRYVVAKSVTATLDFAAVMAQAARLYKGNPDYPEFATQARQAAVNAFKWAANHNDALYNQWELSRQYQPAVNTGTYGDNNAKDELFWAATELFLLTGDDEYKQEATSAKPKEFTTPVWGMVAGLAAMEWVASGGDMAAEMKNQLADYAEKVAARSTNSSFHAPFGDRKEDFGWGCLAEQCCIPAVALLMADKYISQGKYNKYALQNISYILGRNPLGYCYVTGFGQKSPMHPHHRISEADGITNPFPGMLVGGPNPGQQDKGSGLTYASNLPDESYLDEMPSYASNEIAINWNASLVALLSWLDAKQ